MKKGKVVDIFSKRPMDEEKQDTKKNDLITEDMGRYVGSITKDRASKLRHNLNILNGRRAQITELILKWEEDYANHTGEIFDILAGDLNLKTDDFDPVSEDVYIDEEGSVFLLERQDVNTKNVH